MSEIIERPGLYRTVVKYRHKVNHALKGNLTFEHLHGSTVDPGGVPLSPKDQRALQAALVASLAPLFHEEVVIKRAVTSTYTRDSEPYNPFALVVQEFNTSGLIAAVGDVAPWEFTMHIVREPEVGNVGRLMVRGAIGPADTDETPEGVVVNSATLTAYINRVQAFWESIQADFAAKDGILVMAGEPLLQHNRSLPEGPTGPVVDDPDYADTIIRQVVGMTLKGITIKQKEQ